MHYPIGTTYTPRGKDTPATVTDILTTTDHAGNVVSVRYIAVHSFLGQMVADQVTAVAIARGNPSQEPQA